MDKRRILIVDDGLFKTPGNLDYYTSYVNCLMEIFDSVVQPKSKLSDPEVKAAKVEVVDSASSAVEILAVKEFDIVIFVSGGTYKKACHIRASYPNTKVLILSGKPIQGQPYIVPKILMTRKGMCRIPLEL